MKRIKLFFALLAVTAMLFGVTCRTAAYSLSDYNVNGDKDNAGKSKVDVCDYVRIKKLYTAGSATYDGDFFVSLRKVIIGKEELPAGNTGGAIYLPEAP